MESAEEKSDLFTVPHIKHSLTAERSKMKEIVSFLCILNRFIYQVPALLVVPFRLRLLNYLAVPLFSFTTMSAFTSNTLKQRALLHQKRLAFYFPAAFGCKTLRQL